MVDSASRQRVIEMSRRILNNPRTSPIDKKRARINLEKMGASETEELQWNKKNQRRKWRNKN